MCFKASEKEGEREREKIGLWKDFAIVKTLFSPFHGVCPIDVTMTAELNKYYVITASEVFRYRATIDEAWERNSATLVAKCSCLRQVHYSYIGTPRRP